jgi:hypothetical protein
MNPFDPKRSVSPLPSPRAQHGGEGSGVGGRACGTLRAKRSTPHPSPPRHSLSLVGGGSAPSLALRQSTNCRQLQSAGPDGGDR